MTIGVTTTGDRYLEQEDHTLDTPLAEAALIVSSVYLAIVLEGASADRGRRAEAVAALTALRAEMELDRADAVEILALQAAQIQSSERVRRWLSQPMSAPADSLSMALLHVLTDNRTMFPRTSSWTTMVAGAAARGLGAGPHTSPLIRRDSW